jgi:hypothetical protein
MIGEQSMTEQLCSAETCTRIPFSPSWVGLMRLSRNGRLTAPPAPANAPSSTSRQHPGSSHGEGYQLRVATDRRQVIGDFLHFVVAPRA